MNGTITLEQAELLIAQLPPQEQLRLVAGISERLSKLDLIAPETKSGSPSKPISTSREALQRMVEVSEEMRLYDE